mmetsp:Transcript_29059/g.58582  ORF Transcript_29059/g.58582 Transcript_29059/m.58582 type:complete len:132 (+) Transcript_29059:67-462(+)
MTPAQGSTRRRDVRRSKVESAQIDLSSNQRDLRLISSTHSDKQQGSGAVLSGALHITGQGDCVLYASSGLWCAALCVCCACHWPLARFAQDRRRASAAFLLHPTSSTTLCFARYQVAQVMHWSSLKGGVPG